MTIEIETIQSTVYWVKEILFNEVNKNEYEYQCMHSKAELSSFKWWLRASKRNEIVEWVKMRFIWINSAYYYVNHMPIGQSRAWIVKSNGNWQIKSNS